MPHRNRVARPDDLQIFLAEARTLAKLEHPNVVPVHDVGNTPDGICYIVSRFIDGSDLHHRMQSSPLSIGEAVELIATMAEALHYVHMQGVIHRDIKPSNILLDKRGRFLDKGRRGWPLGTTKPNDLGVFDMITGSREWVSEKDPKDPKRVGLCGYSFRENFSEEIKPRLIGYDLPDLAYSFNGFRVVRSRLIETETN